MTTPTVGVVPSAEHRARSRLFESLGLALGVRFEPREPGQWQGLAAAAIFDAPGLPSPPQDVARIVFPPPGRHETAPLAVRFASSPPVPGVLRGRSLAELATAVGERLVPAPGEAVLAEDELGPLWTSRSWNGVRVDRVAAVPGELGPGRRLRDKCAAGDFLSLLPVVEFLRAVVHPQRAGPALRACFMFDDPNLRWRSYGYLRFPELARHAETHGYHVSIAMIPRDARFAHRETVRLFRSHPRQLSLCVHGNDHVRREFTQPLPDAEAYRVALQARSRIDAFERRAGARVERVFVPPHRSASPSAMRGLLHGGFVAVCHAGWRQEEASVVAGWSMGDMALGDGLPELRRATFRTPVDELVLRAYLGQPIILYGHHVDLAEGGLDRLAALADVVGGLGPVEWLSPERIARTNVATEPEDGALGVWMSSRQVRLAVPHGVERIVVRSGDPAGGGASPHDVVLLDGVPAGPMETALPCAGGRVLEIALRGTRPSPRAAPRPLVPRPWPPLRRIASESRDRLLPLVHHLSVRRG